MSEESDIALELQESREATGFSREKVAQAIGKSAKTIERWETTGRLGPAELRRIRAFYAEAAAGHVYLDNDVIRSTNRSRLAGVSEASPSYSPARITIRVALWLADFVAALRDAKVPDDEIDEAVSLVTHPTALTRNKGGKRVDLTEDEAIEEMDALAHVVFDRQRKMGRKIK
jgi:transcriptional regulator with XRE-family HTH domain